ncbi:TetR/AcrR family transcriptional regulator [Pseudomonas sp. Fl4BN1]|uniref:TetR/AcrR family transcriptional regulator n=1 Tax=Pseudomonas sp. Fl4BN1 TaxID=2697651 RepID=UPI001376E576|nr:TetR/AcrR family transcriptional regulator [Pseudomonas sp. Fl4BN1]NBF09760.1 TetR family transcriptional regulator [Pseudomonas sp. Fl4BN1]
MSSSEKTASHPAQRRRMSREQRLQQLMTVAWQIVRERGTEALTLGNLAEQAGVTKPVVYDHFATRAVLLAALYQDFDQRQTARMDQALQNSEPTLASRATVIASAYVDCVLLQGREIPGVIAALASSPELEAIKGEYQKIFLKKCRDTLEPFAADQVIATAGLRAMLGAAEAVSHAAALEEITPAQAQDELRATIMAMVERARANASAAIPIANDSLPANGS